MARIPQFQEQFISTRVPDQSAGDLGQAITGVGGLLVQTDDVLQQRKLASDMTRVSELSTDFELQMQDELEAFKQERADNTDNFSTDFDTLFKEEKEEFLAESGLGTQGRQALSKIIEGKRVSFGTSANKYEAQQQITNFANSVERTTEKNNLLAYRAGENLDIEALSSVEASVDANILAGASFVPADQLEKMKRTQTQGAYTDWFEGAIDTDPYQSLDLLESQQFDKKLGVDNLQTLTTKARKRINTLETELEKKRGKINGVSKVVGAMNGEVLLDPKTKDDVKAVEDYWEFIDEEHNQTGADFETRIEDAKVLSEKVGIIPPQVQTVTSAMLFNGDTSQQALSAEFISDITNQRPRASEQYDAKTRTFAQAIVTNINAGLDQDRAVIWARKTIDTNLEKPREFRALEYKGGKNAKQVQKDIERMKSSITPFFGGIEIQEDLVSDFATLQEGYFMNEGVDRNTAYESAKKDILNFYGVTEIGGKRYMKYAPEAYYGREVEDNFGVKPDWIKKQVHNKVLQEEPQLFESEKQRKEFMDNISLGVNPDSIIGGESPSYYIFTRDEFNGESILTDKNNQPIEYIPNFQETEEYQLLRSEMKPIESREDIRQKINNARSDARFRKKMDAEDYFNLEQQKAESGR
jgi:hypothetical protein